MSRISQLTALTAVDRADLLATVDVSDTTQSAAGSTKKVTVTSVFEAMGGPGIAQGRLSVVSGNSVGEGSAAGTLYYTPHTGDRIALWDGTNWSPVQFTERSLALSVTSGSVYDIFGYLSSGVLTLESLVWTNTTTRATAIAQTTNGVRIKSGDATRRYLGTIYATGTNQTSDANAARCVWNEDNRVHRRLMVLEPTSHLNSGTSARNWNGTTTNTRVEFVVGQYDDRPIVGLWSDFTPSAGVTGTVGLQMDASTMPSVEYIRSVGVQISASTVQCFGAALTNGYHYLQMVEQSSGTCTFAQCMIDGTVVC